MSARTEWSELKQRSLVMSREAMIEPFCKWTEVFAAEEKERDGVFVQWLSWPEEKRQAALHGLIGGEVVKFGTGPQLEGVLLAALYHVLTFGRVIVSTTTIMDFALVRRVCRCIEELLEEPVRHVGSYTGVRSALTIQDVVDAKFVIADYHMLIESMFKAPPAFKVGMCIMFYEIDVSLYANRIMFMDRGVPTATGMIYRTSRNVEPRCLLNKNVYDIKAGLHELNIEVSGSVSYIDKMSAEQLNEQYNGILRKSVVPSPGIKRTAYAYRTAGDRLAALLGDILKCKNDVLVFFSEESIGAALQEELRKSGQSCVLVNDADETATALETGNGKHVILQNRIPTTLSAVPKELRPASLFVADLFINDLCYEKMLCVAQRLAKLEGNMRVYFSLDDMLMKIYEEQGGFEKFFSLMEFTEKYDSMRQIRRVMANMILRRLDKMRKTVLDDTLPLVTTSLKGRTKMRSYTLRTTHGSGKKSSIGEGLCFCGSGKPFKECHGKSK